MNADKHSLLESDLTEQVIGIFYTVYNELGAGFLESVYENAFAAALGDAGLSVVQQAPINVHFRGILVGEFKADLLVEGRVIVELKAVSQLGKVHEVQLINYLKATGIPVGLLFNFGPRPQFKRRVFDVLSHPRSSASIRVKDNV
ncbi:GxxExxY protein [Thermomonas sp.]|uniref:GxxExxY protein n=1 Tax=Thermomonas sp. TaxID=1971895 RepID=UPI0026159A22|nr:GxxExxY protein [Thermomonas sp.]